MRKSTDSSPATHHTARPGTRTAATLAVSALLISSWWTSPAGPAHASEVRPAAGSSPASPADAELRGIDLNTVTIPQLQARMASGALTPSGLTRAYLKRIKAIDPKIHSVLRTDPTALQQAARSDARHRRGAALGPLDGIPVLIKDNVDTKGLLSTAGSLALATAAPQRDAGLVTRLREAGAVILGKTNLSEWANFRAAKPTSGWSAVGGQTHNPYVLDRNPCGSSAGSGAALAASLAQVAIGTETDGSIVCPAGMNGVVGLKPTLGVVSGRGVVPISAEQDTAGPMARNVVDVALTLAALREKRDKAYVTGEGAARASGTTADGSAQASMRGRRIGLWRLPSLGKDVDKVMTTAAQRLRSAGATVVEVTPPYQDRLAELEFPALLSEFHRDINAYLAGRRGPRNLAELTAFHRGTPAEQTCFAGVELFESALTAPPTTDPQYRAARAELTRLARKSIDDTMAAHRLDAIATPTNPPAWTTDCARGDNDVIPSSTPAAVAGYPSLSVPAGSVGELPVGLLLMSGKHKDEALLSLGAQVEQRLRAWRAPRYLPTLPTPTASEELRGTGR
ncbi:amidase [Streptomyces spiroverticillatus]|nr:amidase [Streptomyces spiroverticillatus]